MAGHHWVTIVTAMFLHASWSHIIGNMIFLWAFSPEIEDAMGRGRYLVFYLAGGLVAMLAQVLASPHSTVPNLGASGAIAAVMGAFIVTYPRDRIRSVLFIFVFFRVTFIPAALLIGFWFLTQLFNAGQVAQAQSGGNLAGGNATDAWAVFDFTYTASDGTKIDMSEYIECRSLPKNGVLLIDQIVASKDYNDQIATRRTLLNSLKHAGAVATPGA